MKQILNAFVAVAFLAQASFADDEVAAPAPAPTKEAR
jgi:hypothetical protein